MSTSIGRRTTVGAVIESTPGQTSNPKVFLPWLENSLVENFEPLPDNAARGVRDLQGGLSASGRKWGEGNLRVILNPEETPILFAAALGSSSITALGGGLFRHIFTRKTDTEPTTLTIWMDRVVDKVEFIYSTVDTLDLEFSEDVVSINLAIQSKFPSKAEYAVTPAFEQEDIYTFKNAKAVIGTNGAASTELKIREFNMSINNNVEKIYVPNSNNDVDRIVSRGFEATGSFRLLFENETNKDAFAGLTKKSVAIVFNEGATTGEIVVYFPQVRFQNLTLNLPLDDLSEESIEFVAETGASQMSIAVKNEKNNYLN